MTDFDLEGPAPRTRSLDAVTGLSRKGLPRGQIGVLGALVVGISTCAPAITLTASVGPAASIVGDQTPAIFLVGFIPMLLVAFGYRALNTAMPDSGTSFTWGVRAFGPWLGWLTGWGLVASTVLVLSNLAGIAVDFFYQTVAIVFQNESLAQLTENPLINVVTCLSFMAVATIISYRGMTSTKIFQYCAVFFQVGVLAWFFIALVIGATDESNPAGRLPELSWFDPTRIDGFSALSAGLAVSIFVYWGWDTVLTMGEETRKSRGRVSTESTAATILLAFLVVTYVGIAAATIAFAGTGETGTGLSNPDIAENVFAALAHPVMGPVAIVLSLAILVSAMASINSTAISPARTLLAMAHYGAMPGGLRRVHPRFKSPSTALLTSSIIASVFYAVLRFVSEDTLWDTITTLSIMVCFYYGLTALASSWYFRRQALTGGWRFALTRVVLPGIGGCMLLVIFAQTFWDSMDPAFGSGSQILGVGLVGIMGLVLFAVGIAIMLLQAKASPAFFRGETLGRSDAVADAADDATRRLSD
jgi:amino acid transporter